MLALRTIEIDWEIHQLIEAERRGFDEPPHLALRRLLKLPDLVSSPEGPPDGGTGKPWTEEGVEIPHGSLAQMKYLRGKQVYEGKFLDGKLVVNGRSYLSLSSAASAFAKTKDGSNPQLNGWLYWKVKLPGEAQWKLADDLRRAAEKEVPAEGGG